MLQEQCHNLFLVLLHRNVQEWLAVFVRCVDDTLILPEQVTNLFNVARFDGRRDEIRASRLDS